MVAGAVVYNTDDFHYITEKKNRETFREIVKRDGSCRRRRRCGLFRFPVVRHVALGRADSVRVARVSLDAARANLDETERAEKLKRTPKKKKIPKFSSARKNRFACVESPASRTFALYCASRRVGDARCTFLDVVLTPW